MTLTASIRISAPLFMCAAALASCSPLKTFNAFVPKDNTARQAAEGIAYGTDDRQKLDVYLPKADAARADGRPLVVFFYGGSWNSGTRKGYDFVGRALAARGFVTVIPDYRLVPEVTYPAFVEDGASAVRWARVNAAQYGADPDKVVVIGHSAGAYIAAMLALDERFLADDRAALRGFVGLAGPYDFLPFDGPVTQTAFGNWPKAAETQPVTYAGKGDPAALLLSGADDTTVLPVNSEKLAAKLRAGGVDADVKFYEGVGHVGIITSIAKPLRGKSPALDDIGAFVERVTAGD
ncbi:alpha/beta hydrolase [Altererythrobacter aquiaggeris]|uniref:alpha/beta hydrolase n=1 Tax=Aestuarierythrobacter aquiaggeris TaxID=1898396 RepID=UPI003019C11A